MDKWITTGEAAEALSISERQVRNRALAGKLKARREGKKWLIHSSLSPVESEMGGNSTELSEVKAEMAVSDEGMARLEADNEWLRRRVENLEAELKDTRRSSDEARQRQDTILLQLTRQLESQQKMLEHHQSPWWRRWWFRKQQANG